MASSLDIEPVRGPRRDGNRSRTLPPAHEAAGFIAEAQSRPEGHPSSAAARTLARATHPDLDPDTVAVLKKEAARSLDVEPARGPPRDGKRSRKLPPAHAAADFIAEARSRWEG